MYDFSQPAGNERYRGPGQTVGPAMRATRVLTVLGGAVVAALIAAPAAHADTNGYIARLQREGVPMLSGTVPAVQAGLTGCAMIRDGVPPQDVASQVAGLWSGVLGPRIVAAAQDELCPDTL
jgi:hypothetical protein